MKITKRVIDAAQPEAKRYIITDATLPGFRVVVTPAGKKTFAVRYRVGGGRGGTIREPTIGTCNTMTVDHARDVAKRWLSEAAEGGDPAAARDTARQAPSMNDLMARYITDHARPRKKASSLKNDERLIASWIAPNMGNVKVSELNRAQVSALHSKMKEHPYEANRVRALLSNAMNKAEEWGLRPDGSNPCRHVKPYAEKARKRFLTAAELERLGVSLERGEKGVLGPVTPQAVAAIRLLLFTGARRGEILGLRWEWIDWEGRRAILPDSKSGDKAITLPPPALEVLQSIRRREGNPYVITGRKSGSHLVNLKDPWGIIRADAGLDDVRLHDLRHTFGAVGAGAGASLHIVGGLLGHSQPQTTKRYAHLADHPLQAAATTIAEQVAANLKGAAGEVVPFKGKANG